MTSTDQLKELLAYITEHLDVIPPEHRTQAYLYFDKVAELMRRESASEMTRTYRVPRRRR